MGGVPIVLATHEGDPARAGEAGLRVERILPSDDGEEFMHLDAQGGLVHRVAGERSYLLGTFAKLLPGAPRFAALAYELRVAEKAFELATLWERPIHRIEGPHSLAARLLWELGEGWAPPLSNEPLPVLASPRPISSADLIVCTYQRFDDLLVSLPSILAEAQRARDAGIDCAVTLVHQEAGLPARLAAALPELRATTRLAYVFSAPPGLTRARNRGLRATHRDLSIFIDDDVLLDPGFVVEHVAAARCHPQAVGVAGQIRSRIERQQLTRHRAVGQIRPTGFIETHYDSQTEEPVLVPHTPMGANMAFRRAELDALLGPSWFDEALTGSAFREESTLGMKLFRCGRHLVFAPKAGLYHFESLVGGCESRAPRPLAARAEQVALDHLFVGRLHRRLPLGRALASLLIARRELRNTPTARVLAAKLFLQLCGYQLAQRRLARLGSSRID